MKCKKKKINCDIKYHRPRVKNFFLKLSLKKLILKLTIKKKENQNK